MEKNTKIVLGIVVVVLALAVLSGNLDLGNLFSTIGSSTQPAVQSVAAGGGGYA